MCAIASTPWSAREPCAATPCVSTSSQTNPLCARQRLSSVGSVTMPKSAWNFSRTANVPRLATSSSATAVTMRSPFNRSVAASRAVTMIAARLAFMSQAPRPYTRPSRTTGENGSAIPPAPTVSMCALSIRLRPPPVPCSTPTTLGRPGIGSTISTSRPASPSHDETNFAIAVSPLPDATRSGFTDSMATSSAISDSTATLQTISAPSLAFFPGRITLPESLSGAGIRGFWRCAAYVSIVSTRPDIRDRLRHRDRRRTGARLGGGGQPAKRPLRDQPYRRHLRGEPQLRQLVWTLGRRQRPRQRRPRAHDPGCAGRYAVRMLEAERRQPHDPAASGGLQHDEQLSQPAVPDQHLHPTDRHHLPAAGPGIRPADRVVERYRHRRRMHTRHRASLLPGAVPAQQRAPEPVRHRERRDRPDDGLLRHHRTAGLRIPARRRAPALCHRGRLLPGCVRRLVPKPPVADRGGQPDLGRGARRPARRPGRQRHDEQLPALHENHQHGT